MTTPAWPSNLNDLAECGSWGITPNDPLLRSEFDYGPARVRRRFTRQMQEVTFRVVLTAREFEYFEGFYADDLNYGASWFTMSVYTGRNTYETRKVRFKEVPKYGEAGYGHTSVSFKLETINAPAVSGETAWLGSFFGEDGLYELGDQLDYAVNTQYPAATLGG